MILVMLDDPTHPCPCSCVVQLYRTHARTTLTQMRTSAAHSHTLALVFGSEPQYFPNKMPQQGYIHNIHIFAYNKFSLDDIARLFFWLLPVDEFKCVWVVVTRDRRSIFFVVVFVCCCCVCVCVKAHNCPWKYAHIILDVLIIPENPNR